MAKQINFDNTLYLRGEELVLDNGANAGVIKSENGTVQIEGATIITGDLTVQGTTTTVQSETVNIEDNTIMLNSEHTGTPTETCGIQINRGSSYPVSAFWNETVDRFEFKEGPHFIDVVANTFRGSLIGGTITGSLKGNVTSTGNDLILDSGTDGTDATLTVNSATITSVDINGGNIDSTIIGATTPSTGTFSTITGDGTNITNVLTNYTTTNLTEGTNKYFTDARIDTHLNQSNPNPGYVLSWNGTDYAWAPQSSGSSVAEQDFAIHTADFNATSGSRHAVDTSSAVVTATLPASPATGDAIFFADAGENYATNNLTIARNGNTIMGSATDMTVSTNNQSFGLFYNGSTWRIY